MPRKDEESVAVRRAIVGIATVAVVMMVALNLSRISNMLGKQEVSAHLTDGGGIRSGDEVRVDGLRVGSVSGLKLEETSVRLDFKVGGVEVGNKSRVYIRSANALGRKYVDLELGGTGNVASIPVSRTDPGYAVTEVLGDLTTNTAQLDTAQITTAFESLSSVLEGSPEEFGDALSGVRALSQTISSRDGDLALLLKKASSVSEVLAKRNQEISAIFGDGSAIFQELILRREYISSLLENVVAATDQIQAFVKENDAKLPKSLTDLKAVADVLASYRSDLESSIVDFSGYVRGLGDAVASGPFFQALIPNLTTPESIVTGALTGGIESAP